MNGFIIICALFAISMLILPFRYDRIAERRTNYGSCSYDTSNEFAYLTVKHIMFWIGVVLCTLMWLCGLLDLPYMKTVAWILTGIFILFTLISEITLAEYGMAAFLMLMFIGICPSGPGGYRPEYTESGVELRSPMTYWITRKVEKTGKDSFHFNMVGSIGRYDNSRPVTKVYGLRNEKGYIYIPKICDYSDRFTRLTLEPFQGNRSNVDIMHFTAMTALKRDAIRTAITPTGTAINSPPLTIATPMHTPTDATKLNTFLWRKVPASPRLTIITLFKGPDHYVSYRFPVGGIGG